MNSFKGFAPPIPTTDCPSTPFEKLPRYWNNTFSTVTWSEASLADPLRKPGPVDEFLYLCPPCFVRRKMLNERPAARYPPSISRTKTKEEYNYIPSGPDERTCWDSIRCLVAVPRHEDLMR